MSVYVQLLYAAFLLLIDLTFTFTILVRIGGSHYAVMESASANKVIIRAVQNYLQQDN